MTKHLPKSEVIRLLKHTKDDEEYLLLVTCFNYALRVGELVRLRVEDIDFEKKIINIPTLKWHTSKSKPKGTIKYGKLPKNYVTFPLDDKMAKIIKIYLEEYKIKEGWLFPDANGHMPEWKAQRIFKRVAKRAGIPGYYSIHCLRHSRGVDIYENTGDLAKTQEWLRHRDISTTRVYATMSLKVREQVIKSVGVVL